MSANFVHAFTHLKDKPKADRALPMLQRIASLVKPIMRKHSWNLPVLAEFFPESPNLIGLNVNKGQKICLRLRPAHAPDTFYDEEDVVQTMLHEASGQLTHNVHGPHDDKFYKFLSGLQNEYDALQRSGYAGEGFFSKGRRVGAEVSHDLPPHLARLKALEAAEKRRQTSRVLGSGGRLGGRINAKGLTPRDLAAQAAERRTRDEKACGSGAVAHREAAKAAKESIEDKVVDLTMDDSDEDMDVIVINQKKPLTGSSEVPFPHSRQPTTLTDAKKSNIVSNQLTASNNRTPGSSTRGVVPNPANAPAKASPEWSCLLCTLLNQPLALQCDACFTERPPDRTMGWACLNCGEASMPNEHWTCRFCGTVKTTS